MNKQYQWATEDIFTTDAEWNKTLEEIDKKIDFSEFKGKLNKAENYLALQKKIESIGSVIEKLSVYAMMKHDEDTTNSLYDSFNSKIYGIYAKFSSSLAFVQPELISLDQEVLKSYINNTSLSEYDYSLKCLLKEKAHVLSADQEALLAAGGEVFSSFRDIFTKIDNADLPLGKIKVDNKTVQLTHGTYSMLLQNTDVKVRQKAFKKYYKAYISLINVISSTYYASVKKNVYLAKARKYPSAMASALAGEDVPEIVYKNLLTNVKKALPDLHAYMGEKKKALGLDKMHMYDIYVPTVEGVDLKLEYDDAYSLVVEGLACLGSEYQQLLLKAKEDRWIDVYERSGKRSGAYSVAVYNIHPYVLLNYQKTTHDVFTIAHEMGHSLHSYFSNKNQPYAKADYTIFVAEVASTVNEVLLIKHLLKTAKDDKLKKYLLSYLLEMIRTTLFRQTQFSEFEDYAHKQVEKGVPLTKDSLCKAYLKLNKKYYGKNIVHDKEIKYEWARIPHFYRAFYVYKYATGIISALSIARRILEEGQTAVDDYFKFLSSGGSDSPVELLKIAGVDLTQEKPYQDAFAEFKSALEAFVKL
ncbi:MAG: oligoendopeptidase F [Clostridia bacterium]|nr:oligoendopeptidase F [Clostridia bacterium]